MTAPAQVFICYARADNESAASDERWLDRVRTHLKPYEATGELEVFCDDVLRHGEDWHGRIRSELQRARVAVLLVSAEFMASDYIRNSELPVLLQRAKEEGVVIVPVLLSASAFDKVPFRYPDPRTGPETRYLSSLQSEGTPDAPLAGRSRADQEGSLARLAVGVRDLAVQGRRARLTPGRARLTGDRFAALLPRYLERLIHETSRLDLANVDPKSVADDPGSAVALSAVYTALDVMGGGSDRLGAGGGGSEPEELLKGPGMGGRVERTPALAWVSRYPAVSLLGDPGSGKSTFANYLALALACRRLKSADADHATLAEEWTAGDLLPVRVELRKFAAERFGPGIDAGDSLWNQKASLSSWSGSFAFFCRSGSVEISTKSTGYASTSNSGGWSTTYMALSYDDSTKEYGQFTIVTDPQYGDVLLLSTMAGYQVAPIRLNADGSLLVGQQRLAFQEVFRCTGD